MTDRELLELAAKAYGLQGRFLNIHGRAAVDADKFWIDGGGIWTPLTSDTDALRLAVALNLQIEPRERTVAAQQWRRVEVDQRAYAMEFCGGNADRMAATRRAIVRAAAEIGRKG